MSDEDDKRAAIIRTAEGFLGAHYLAGTFGAIPDTADRYAPDRSIRLLNGLWDWPTIAVRAAQIDNYEQRTLRCCGRYAVREVGGRRMQWGRASPSPDAAFRQWMERARGAPENQARSLANEPRMFRARTPGFEGRLFPRRHCLVRHGAHEDPDLLYLGEDCAGKHHFDCVGFVCCVLGTAIGRQVRYGLAGVSGSGNWLQDGNTVYGHDSAACVRASIGDVILSNRHMALVHSRGQNVRIIHANGDSRGVEITGLNVPEEEGDRGSQTWGANFQVIHLSRNFLRLG
ncbi:MAG: hypothetical protein MUE73_06285 [Planctomycetes bacterium]|jgi:hypothetical protein|nr:hypothetical protein [Planctomycetota bacterium]